MPSSVRFKIRCVYVASACLMLIFFAVVKFQCTILAPIWEAGNFLDLPEENASEVGASFGPLSLDASLGGSDEMQIDQLESGQWRWFPLARAFFLFVLPLHFLLGQCRGIRLECRLQFQGKMLVMNGLPSISIKATHMASARMIAVAWVSLDPL